VLATSGFSLSGVRALGQRHGRARGIREREREREREGPREGIDMCLARVGGRMGKEWWRNDKEKWR